MARKQSSSQLRPDGTPTTELFQELLARAPVVTYVHRVDQGVETLVFISPRSKEVLGFTPEEIVNETPEARRARLHPDDLASFARGSIKAGRRGYEGVIRYNHPDGRLLDLLMVSVPMLQEAGTTTYRMGLVVDVTAEIQIPQALRESEARFRALVERVPAVVYTNSNEAEPHAIYVSPGLSSLFGYTPEEWMQDASLWSRTVHPSDWPRVSEAWERSVRTGEDFRAEFRCIHRNGQIVWVRDTTTLIRGEDGSPTFWQGVIQDVSDQKLADQALLDTESRYRTLVEQIPAIVYEMGPDDERRTIYVSPHVEKILGYSRQEWLDQPDIWIELLHPADREQELDAHDRHNLTGDPWVRTYRLIAADGRTVWVRDQAVLVRDLVDPADPGTWHGLMLDVSAQKFAEEDLLLANDLLEYRVRERTAELEETNALMALEIAERQQADADRDRAEERYRSLVEQIPAVVYISTVTADGPVLADYSSPQVEGMLGYTTEEWKVQALWVTRIHPHDRDRVLDAWESSKASGDPFSEEFRFLAKDGRIVWVLDQTKLLSRDQAGRPKRFQGVMIDITARKEAEAAAVDAETRYQALASHGPVMAYVWERDPGGGGRHRYMSPQVERLLGYSTEAWSNDNEFWLSIVHPDDRERVSIAEVQTEYTGESWALDYRVITGTGEVRWLHDEGSLLSRDDDGKPHRFHGIYVDITEQKLLEQQLREAEEHYRTFVEQLPAVPWSEEIDTITGRATVTYLGPQAEALLGWTSEEIREDRWYGEQLIHPEDRERIAQAVRDSQFEDTWDQTYRILTREGIVRTVKSVGRRVTDPGARTQIWKGLMIDVSPSASASASAGDAGGAVSPSA